MRQNHKKTVFHISFFRLFVLCSVVQLLLVQPLRATVVDTTAFSLRPQLSPVGRYSATAAFDNDFTYMGLGFVAAGFFVKSRKKDFRDMRHYFQPTFKTTWDNYTQYTPLAATWALNMAGVQGRSSLGRLAVSNALSAVIMASVVNSVKYTVRELRPDNTENNAFPSGHTATAFMAATILHKEYGLTRSPWYSIAGYSVAAATGVCRILNNRHWISDVLVGAGVGFLSTDLGYFLADLMFKGKGISHSNLEDLVPDLSHKPSFVGLSVEVGAGPSRLNTPEVYDSYDDHMMPFAAGDHHGVSHPLGLAMRLGTCSAVKAEGAYFLNDYVGVGGSLRAASFPVVASVNLSHGFRYNVSREGLVDGMEEKYLQFAGIESSHVGMFDLSAGAYFSYPLSSRLRVGSRLLMGTRLTTDYHVDAIANIDVAGLRRFYGPIDAADKRHFENPTDKAELMEILDGLGDGQGVHLDEFMTIEAGHAPVYSTGLSLTWAYRQGMSLKAQLGYDYSAPEYTYHLKNRWQEEPDGTQTYLTDTFKKRTHMSQLSLGLGMTLNF